MSLSHFPTDDLAQDLWFELVAEAFPSQTQLRILLNLPRHLLFLSKERTARKNYQLYFWYQAPPEIASLAAFSNAHPAAWKNWKAASGWPALKAQALINNLSKPDPKFDFDWA